jgi:hypothetical protein
LAGAINALVDDPEARSEQRFRQIRAPATEILHASHAAVRPSPPPADTPTQPPPRNAPDKPSSVNATTHNSRAASPISSHGGNSHIHRGHPGYATARDPKSAELSYSLQNRRHHIHGRGANCHGFE